MQDARPVPGRDCKSSQCYLKSVLEIWLDGQCIQNAALRLLSRAHPDSPAPPAGTPSASRRGLRHSARPAPRLCHPARRPRCSGSRCMGSHTYTHPRRASEAGVRLGDPGSACIPAQPAVVGRHWLPVLQSWLQKIQRTCYRNCRPGGWCSLQWDACSARYQTKWAPLSKDKEHALVSASTAFP